MTKVFKSFKQYKRHYFPKSYREEWERELEKKHPDAYNKYLIRKMIKGSLGGNQ